MIEWYEQLYMDDKVKRKFKKYRSAIERQKLTISLYCIAFGANKDNLFDIISCNELLFRHYRQNHLFVVGLASCHVNALELVRDMVLEVYQQTGGFDVRNYFVNKTLIDLK